MKIRKRTLEGQLTSYGEYFHRSSFYLERDPLRHFILILVACFLLLMLSQSALANESALVYGSALDDEAITITIAETQPSLVSTSSDAPTWLDQIPGCRGEPECYYDEYEALPGATVGSGPPPTLAFGSNLLGPVLTPGCYTWEVPAVAKSL